ncbi:MAG: arginine repressor [Syntrophomonadaceae bacterium]|nr:arginine repressor [Syntrophomonadaceae bacterium]
MKTIRHRAVMDIVTHQQIANQKELCEVLAYRGFDVTQATVSRDIKELNLIKIAGENGYRYAPPDVTPPRSSFERMRRLFAENVVSMDHSENLVVIKTIPGSAHPIASTIDGSGIQEIIGTVAGDDTVVAVIKPIQAVDEILQRFQSMIEPK